VEVGGAEFGGCEYCVGGVNAEAVRGAGWYEDEGLINKDFEPSTKRPPRGGSSDTGWVLRIGWSGGAVEGPAPGDCGDMGDCNLGLGRESLAGVVVVTFERAGTGGRPIS
jgi:hypothetical protein